MKNQSSISQATRKDELRIQDNLKDRQRHSEKYLITKTSYGLKEINIKYSLRQTRMSGTLVFYDLMKLQMFVRACHEDYKS